MSSYGSSTPLPEYRFWFRGHLRSSIQTFLAQFFGDISNVPSEEASEININTDFTTFLNTPGCTVGRCSNVKPLEPEKITGNLSKDSPADEVIEVLDYLLVSWFIKLYCSGETTDTAT